MTILRARTPSRIDFLGGGSDAPPFYIEHGGAVLNGSISRYVTSTLELGPHLKGVEIHSLDFGATVRADDVEALAYDGTLDLVKAVIRRSGLRGPFRLTTAMDLPPQSGLGASGAMSVGLMALCYFAQGRTFSPLEVVDEANAAEREDLGLAGGKQDPCGAAFGGLNCFEFTAQATRRHPIDLTPEQIAELEHRLLLTYTGVSHLSGNIHADIKAAYADDESPCKQAMFALARLGRDGLEVLRHGDLDRFGAMLNDNWRYHKDLHTSCTNDRLEQVYATARQAGVIGGKTCGAGGGGCVVFYCAEGRRQAVETALTAIGCQTLPFTFDFSGIRVWTVGKD